VFSVIFFLSITACLLSLFSLLCLPCLAHFLHLSLPFPPFSLACLAACLSAYPDALSCLSYWQADEWGSRTGKPCRDGYASSIQARNNRAERKHLPFRQSNPGREVETWEARQGCPRKTRESRVERWTRQQWICKKTKGMSLKASESLTPKQAKHGRQGYATQKLP
jgi:hypothetical protein